VETSIPSHSEIFPCESQCRTYCLSGPPHPPKVKYSLGRLRVPDSGCPPSPNSLLLSDAPGLMYWGQGALARYDVLREGGCCPCFGVLVLPSADGAQEFQTPVHLLIQTVATFRCEMYTGTVAVVEESLPGPPHPPKVKYSPGWADGPCTALQDHHTLPK